MSARVSAHEAALKKQFEELNGKAHDAINGIHAIKGFIADLQGEPLGRKIDTALNAIEWMVDKLHFDLDRIADLSDEVAKPLEPEALAEAAE